MHAITRSFSITSYFQLEIAVRITPEYEVRLYDYRGGTIRSLGGICLKLNGTKDHIHLLAKFLNQDLQLVSLS